MEYFSRKIIVIICILLPLCSYDVVASDDEYMRMLEGEAADTVVDTGGKSKINSADVTAVVNVVKKNWVGECDYNNETVPANLLQGEFSSYLKQCASGTYVFYRRLELKSKNLVFENYKEITSVTLFTLRNDILKTFR